MICITDRALSGGDRLFEVVPIVHQKSGGMGIRTPDIQLAKLALYQLSYTPIFSMGVRTGAGGVEKND
jgi:hypothetical protein